MVNHRNPDGFGDYVVGARQVKGDISRPIVTRYFPPSSRPLDMYGNPGDRRYDKSFDYSRGQDHSFYASNVPEDEGVVRLGDLPRLPTSGSVPDFGSAGFAEAA